MIIQPVHFRIWHIVLLVLGIILGFAFFVSGLGLLMWLGLALWLVVKDRTGVFNMRGILASSPIAIKILIMFVQILCLPFSLIVYAIQVIRQQWLIPPAPQTPSLPTSHNPQKHNFIVGSVGLALLLSYGFAAVAIAKSSHVPAASTIIPTATHQIIATHLQPTSTHVPSTATPVPPTVTLMPPTATNIPVTDTPVPPIATSIPPIDTPVPPIATQPPLPPTATSAPTGINGDPWGYTFTSGSVIYSPPGSFCTYFSCIK